MLTINKKLIYTIVFILFFNIMKSYSYENFDGRYKYGEYNNKNKKVTSITTNIKGDIDEEILFIVDFSNSMSYKMGDTTRINYSMDAITNTLRLMSDSNKIGLRIFGTPEDPRKVKKLNTMVIPITSIPIKINRGNISTNIAIGNISPLISEQFCKDTSLVQPITRNNTTNIVNTLHKYQPYGNTPIELALRTAVENDFSNTSSLKHIILVTDGGENCGGDPCKYIKELMKTRNDIVIDVIGITITKNYYSELNCIAESGKGKFYPVNQPDDFNKKFREVFKNVIKPEFDRPSFAPMPIKEKPVQSYNRDITYSNFVYEFDE